VWRSTGAVPGILVRHKDLAQGLVVADKRIPQNAGRVFSPWVGLAAIPGVESRSRDLLVPHEVVLGGNQAVDILAGSYSVDDLFEQLMKGVGGSVISADWGSVAVVWTDLPGSKAALHPGERGLTWLGEFGRPLKPGSLDLYSEPVVVNARGMPADKLFDHLDPTQRSDY